MTSLEDAFREGARWREAQNHNGIVSDRYLLSRNPYVGVQQPTPTAEVSLHDAWDDGYGTGWSARDNYGDPDDEEDYSNPYPALAEPVSIVDMAPGTTFTAEGHDGTERLCAVANIDHTVADLDDCVFRPDDWFDPSTIRAVSPPKES